MLTFSFRLLAYTVCCGTSMMPKGKESHRGGGSRKAEFILVRKKRAGPETIMPRVKVCATLHAPKALDRGRGRRRRRGCFEHLVSRAG